MKIGIFTDGTSVRSKNIFTDISRYPTGKHEINWDILLCILFAGGLNEWEIYSEGGDGFKCEAPPVGCKPISESTNIEGIPSLPFSRRI